MPDDYSERQEQHNQEYKDGWSNAPEEFKREAAMLGLHPDLNTSDSEAMEYDASRGDSPIIFDEDRMGTGSYTPDMANILDTHIDAVVEEFASFFEKKGIDEFALEKFIRLISGRLQQPLEKELMCQKALVLERAIAFLIGDENGNIMARIHALIHAIPRMAALNAFPSMRASARQCGVSPEWMRRSRDRACEFLGVDPPADGVKSPEAKQKYAENANSNHWRKQKFKPTTDK